MYQRFEYEKAASGLRQRILKGRFRPGDKLPGERELCNVLGVSRITVRLALDLLEEEKMLTRRHGSGTYVSDRPQPRLALGIDYAGSVREHAPTLKRRVQEVRTATIADMPETVAGFLPKEKLLFARRADSIGNRVVAWDQCFILEQFAKKLAKVDLAEVDFLDRWMKVCDFRIDSFRQSVSAVAAGDWDCRIMGLNAGEPVLQTIESYEDENGVVAGVFFSRYKPSEISLNRRFDWPSKARGRAQTRSRERAG
ncbi:GntR family transcriptional regulator [soil metagenome]